MDTLGSCHTGTGPKVSCVISREPIPILTPSYADTEDFYHSSIWDPDPESGLGGWGDPAKDYEVPDGALSDFKLSYPTPHGLWRNYTERPWIPVNYKLGNESFSDREISHAVNGYVGDFEGFQKFVEDDQVLQATFLAMFYSILRPKGCHSGLHLTIGGCVHYIYTLKLSLASL